MRAIAIVGSPRVGGNSEILARHCLRAIEKQAIETELIHLERFHILGCTDCGVCKQAEDCPLEDDLMTLYQEMKESQAIILSAPTYFGSAPPEIKALMDRAGMIAHRNGNQFARKVGSPISVSRRAGHNFTFAQLLMWFYINEMIVPGSNYWSIAIGREPGDVEQDREGMDTVWQLGRNIAWLMKKVQGD